MGFFCNRIFEVRRAACGGLLGEHPLFSSKPVVYCQAQREPAKGRLRWQAAAKPAAWACPMSGCVAASSVPVKARHGAVAQALPSTELAGMLASFLSLASNMAKHSRLPS